MANFINSTTKDNISNTTHSIEMCNMTVLEQNHAPIVLSSVDANNNQVIGQNHEPIIISSTGTYNDSENNHHAHTSIFNDEAYQSSFSKYLNTNIENEKQVWTLSEEKLIKVYIEKAAGYKYIYSKCYYYYRNLYLWISIPLGVLIIILTSAQTIFTTLKNVYSEINDNVFNIVSTIISYLVAIFVGIQIKYNFEMKVHQCKNLVEQFDEFEQELKTIINLPVEIRSTPYNVIKNMQIEYHKLVKNDEKIQIPKFIINEYTNKYKGKITLVELANGIDSLIENKSAYRK